MHARETHGSATSLLRGRAAGRLSTRSTHLWLSRRRRHRRRTLHSTERNFSRSSCHSSEDGSPPSAARASCSRCWSTHASAGATSCARSDATMPCSCEKGACSRTEREPVRPKGCLNVRRTQRHEGARLELLRHCGARLAAVQVAHVKASLAIQVPRNDLRRRAVSESAARKVGEPRARPQAREHLLQRRRVERPVPPCSAHVHKMLVERLVATKPSVNSAREVSLCAATSRE